MPPCPHAPHDDGLARLLRSAVARRADRRLLQRYELLTPTAGLDPDPGEYFISSLETEFEAQVVDTGARTISDATAPDADPTIRVSDDGKMAIEHTDLTVRQPKVFYATSATWRTSNLQLADADSKYDLYADRTNALEVRLADGTTRQLDRVLPRTRIAPSTGRTAIHQGLTMGIEQDCIMAAKALMHHADGNRKARLPFTPDVSDWGEFRTARAMVKWVEVHDYIEGLPGWAKAWEKKIRGDEMARAKTAFEARLTTGPTPDGELLAAIAAGYLGLMRDQPDKAAQAAEALGLNKHALANVGEAFETYRVSADQTPTSHRDPTTNRPVRDFWAQHIGAVVAASGGDRVTLENYARTTEIGRLVEAGPHYYFQMYGSRAHQTWHEAWTTDSAGPPVGLPAAHGRDALTAVVRPG